MKFALGAGLLLYAVSVGQAQTTSDTGKRTDVRRMALVVTNGAYSALPSLIAVPQEAQLMKPALAGADFQVTEIKNANLDELVKGIDGFAAGIQPGDVCFFYYSGYAVQDGEDDFLLPVDFNPSSGDNLHNVAYPLTRLAQGLEFRKADLKMFFLEGARQFQANVPDMRPGLRIPDTGLLNEVLFGIPAATDQYTETPGDQVGLFTSALAEAIKREGLPLTELMKEVLKTVMAKSDKQQQPDNKSKLTKEFYFHAPKVVAAPAPRSQNRLDREFYVWIPPGTFMMGCVPGDNRCDKNELPRHQVTLTKGFWMGENEVRVQSFSNFIDADRKKDKDNKPNNKRKMPTADRKVNDKWRNRDHPINNMSWQDAVDYCAWAGGRLPTEAEWEWAARGGKDGQIYPLDPTDPEISRNKANFYGQQGNDHYEYTAPVRSFDAGPFSLYDMAGNVWELVSDYFGRYAAAAATDPIGPETGKEHVRRGGSYDSTPEKHLRISLREPAGQPWPNVGFRCVLDDNDNTQKIFQKQ